MRSHQITLKQLGPGDAPAVHELAQANRDHLTQLGDYKDYVALSEAQLADQLGSDAETTFGIFVPGLIGTVSLIHHTETAFGLGYWIESASAGKGITTSAVGLAIKQAEDLGAKELWAGISRNNAASIRVVEKLGFKLAREQETHLS